MKRLITVILTLCYLCLSIGITVHVHYCMGKMVSVSLWEQEDNHHCSRCGMDKKSSGNDCCKDEHKILKNATDQVLVKDVLVYTSVAAILPAPCPVATAPRILVAYINRSAPTPAPPLIVPACPLYLRIGNLRV